MTWLLVAITPEASITKPEPSELTRCASPPRPFLSKKSLNRSSNGEPLGTLGNGTPAGPFKVCDVEMLTTASNNFSAIGAIDGGPCWAEAGSNPISPRNNRLRVASKVFAIFRGL